MGVVRESRPANIRFGAAVYGSFLVASVIGVAFEAGQDARFMTMTAFGSALVFWLAHWWSEVIGEQISAGEAFRHRDVLVVARREWPLVEAAVVPTAPPRARLGRRVVARDGRRARARRSRAADRGWALVAGRRAGWTCCARASSPRARNAGLVLLLLEKLVH